MVEQQQQGATAEENAEQIERRYRAVLELRPQHPDAVKRLLRHLGDASWRVRKAALTVLWRFAEQPGLVEGLIAGLHARTRAGLRNACAEGLVLIGERGVAQLADALPHTDANQRKFLVEILGDIGGTEACSRLIQFLDDPDLNVRAAVAEGLGKIGGQTSVNALLDTLAKESGDLQMSVYLLDALARANATIPFDQLAAWTQQRALARYVHPLLARCGDARAIPVLMKALCGSGRGTRETATLALGQLIDDLDATGKTELAAAVQTEPKARDHLLELLGATNERVAEAAVALLGTQDDVSLALPILEACATRNFLQAGIDVIHTWGKPAVAALADALRTVDIETRVLALEIMEALADQDVVPVCLEFAAGPEARSAEAAVRVLARVGGPDVFTPLAELVETGDRELLDQVVLAIVLLGHRHDEVADRARAALSSTRVEPAWLAVLGGFARDQDLGVILHAARHRNPEVRQAALEAASHYGDRIPAETFILALTDEVPQVRVEAARALAAFDHDTTRRALLAAVHDSDQWVVAAAVRSLGSVGGEAAGPALIDAAGSRFSGIALAGLQGLFQLNPPGLEKAIRRAIEHADPEVVREAISLSMRLPNAQAGTLLTSLLNHRSWEVRRAAAESLANRHLPVPAALLAERQQEEQEPLVRQALEGLSVVEDPL